MIFLLQARHFLLAIDVDNDRRMNKYPEYKSVGMVVLKGHVALIEISRYCLSEVNFLVVSQMNKGRNYAYKTDVCFFQIT